MDKENKQRRLACFFDSGIGGLNLLYECVIRRSDCDFAYFADNYNVPYGNLTHGKILSLVCEKFEVISRLNPSVAVVACNTVTAECISFLRQKYSFPIVGIQPAVKPAAAQYKNCVALATPATAESWAVENLIARFGGGHTKVVACPDLAAYIEKNIFNIDEGEVVKLLPSLECDSVIIGCTHYSYVADIISEHYKCKVFDGIKGTADRFCNILGDPEFDDNQPPSISFYGGDYMKNYRVFSYLKANNRN